MDGTLGIEILKLENFNEVLTSSDFYINYWL